MKKLLTIAAALVVAAVTQAATTSWDYYIYMNDSEGNDLEGTLVLAQGGSKLVEAILEDGFAEGTIDELVYGPTDTLDATLTTKLNSGDVISKTISFGLNMPYAGKPDVASSLLDLCDQIAIGYCGSALDELDLGMTVDEAKAAGWTVDGPGPDPVPEPTSLALIALGVAAFGLKRKHA